MEQGKNAAYVMCFVLGLGLLFPWNSICTIMDYYSYLFPGYHPSRVLTLVYQASAFIAMAFLTYYEAKINTQLRVQFGFLIYLLASFLLPILDLSTNGHESVGLYIGIGILCMFFGISDAIIQGGIVGELSYMHPSFLQSFAAGVGASGAATSILRLVTKAAFPGTRDGLRKGALLFFFISAFFELLCLVLYAMVFPRLKMVREYREAAAKEGATTVNQLLDKDIENRTTRLSNIELLKQNADYAFDGFGIFLLTLSIFPGFLAEDTGTHSLGPWYVVILIATYNLGDVVGRYLPLIKTLRVKSRKAIFIAVIARFAFIPAFYFIAKYGDQGWMIMLCVFLGMTNGHLTVSVLVNVPNGYKGPEQNALGNIVVLFILGGVFAGITLGWLWLIGRGW